MSEPAATLTNRSPARRPTALGVAFVVLLAACGGSAGGSPGDLGPYGGAPPGQATGTAALCSVLTPADFAAAGVAGAGQPKVNADAYGAYCVYAGDSGATGGIELDVFPHADEGSAHDTYATAAGEGPGGDPPPGAPFDEATFAVADDVAFLTARSGTTVVALAVPDDVAVDALVTLASLAVQRTSELER